MNCSVSGCENLSVWGKLCNKHSTQMYRYGRIKNNTTSNNFLIEGSITKIECFNKKGDSIGFALIDTEDLEKCNSLKWNMNKKGYLSNGANPKIYLHHIIMNQKGIDHINRNPRDNRKENLRVATKAQNVYNSTKSKSSTKKYVGVFKSKNNWCAIVQKEGVLYRSQTVKTIEEAGLLYNEMAKNLHGEFAYQNTILKRRTKHAASFG